MRTGHMESIGKTTGAVIEGLRALLIRQREHIIMNLRTTQTEIAAEITHLEHNGGGPSVDAARRRLADVAAEIAALETSIVELREIGKH